MIAQELRVSSDDKAGATSTSSERWSVRTARARERGLWSFLTWSFFLSQILAAQQFIGSTAHAAQSTEGSSASGDGSSASAVAGPNGGAIIGDGPTDQEPGPGAAPDQAPSGLSGEAPRLPPDASPQQELGLSLEPFDGASHGGAGVSLPLEATAVAAAAAILPGVTGESAQSTGPGALDPILHPVLGTVDDLLDTLDPVLDGIISPVLGTVGDLVEGLEPVLDQLVSPVLGTVGDLAGTLNPLLEPVLGTVGDVVDTLDPVVDTVVSPVLAIVGDLTDTLDPVLDQVAAPLLGNVGDLISPLQAVIEPLTAPALGTVTEVASEIGPLPSLAGLGLESAEGAPGAGDLLASGGTVVLQELPIISSIALDDLFVGGTYTDFNLELQSTSETGTQSTSAGVSESLIDSEIADQADIAALDLGQGGSEPGLPPIALPSILDEIALRGLGDGIS